MSIGMILKLWGRLQGNRVRDVCEQHWNTPRCQAQPQVFALPSHCASCDVFHPAPLPSCLPEPIMTSWSGHSSGMGGCAGVLSAKCILFLQRWDTPNTQPLYLAFRILPLPLIYLLFLMSSCEFRILSGGNNINSHLFDRAEAHA